MHTMRIIELQAENFAKLKAVTIRPDGALVVLAGKNRNGKTSTLNAIACAFQGEAAAPPEPIRDGCERSRVRVEVGGEKVELIVTRTFVRDDEAPKGWTTALKVEKAGGCKVDKPQLVLNAMLGKIAFDPMQFTDADDDAKLAMLRPIVPEVDFEAEKTARKADYDARTVANADAKRLRTQAEAVVLPPGKVPARVDVSAVEDELAGAAQFNADIEQRKANRAQARQEIERLEADIADLEAKIAAAHDRKATLEAKLAVAEPLPEPKDILALRARMTEARSLNEVADKAARKTALAAEAQAAEDRASGLTKAIAERDARNAAAVAKAVSRVPGLGFSDERLTLNGRAFAMASDAEQLEAAVAVAGILNPTLRVVRIRDGSRLDEDAMVALERICERLDLQAWVERVDSSGAVGFVLEDGELKGPGTSPASRADAEFGPRAAPTFDPAEYPISTADADEVIL